MNNTTCFGCIVNSLKSVKKAGDYATGGACSMTFPSLLLLNDDDIPDVTLSFPIDEIQAKSIISSATQTPCNGGNGSWQLSPKQFTINNFQWQEQLCALVDIVKDELGCSTTRVTCCLQKLLMHGPSTFVKCLENAEKSDRAFGTLYIQLPSNYHGGQLSVYHQSESKEFDFGCSIGLAQFHYSAFYANCRCEVRPITKGYCLSLVYDLVHHDCICPVVPDNHKLVSAIASCMKEWNGSSDIALHPLMMTYMLEHKYSEVDLSFESLKDCDKAVASVLKLAKGETEFDAYLASVCIMEKWSANLYDSFDYNLTNEAIKAKDLKSFDEKSKISSINLSQESFVPAGFFDSLDPDEEELEEATEGEGATVTKHYNWAALLLWPPKNRMRNLGITNMVSLLKKDLYDQSISKDVKVEIAGHLVGMCASPDHGDSMSMESCVSLLQILQCLDRVDLISKFLDVVAALYSSLIEYPSFCDEILATGLKYGWNLLRSPLQAIFNKISSSDSEKYCRFLYKLTCELSSEVQKDVCQGLAKVVVSVFKEKHETKKEFSSESYSLLQSLQNLGDAMLVSDFLQHIVSTSVPDSFIENSSFNDEILSIGLKYGWEILRSPLQSIFKELSSSGKLVEKYGRFLHRISLKPSEIQKDVCRGLASVIVSVLSNEEDSTLHSMFDFYNVHVKAKRSAAFKEFLIILFKCLDTIQCDKQLIANFIQAIIAKPKRYSVVSMLVPVSESLYQSLKEGEEVSQSLTILLSQCISSLEVSSNPVVPCPADWSESATLSCHCSDCMVVSCFLKHPTQTVCQMKIGKSRRYHLHCQLDDDQCPVTHVTEHFGNPQTLIVTKIRSTEYEEDRKRSQKEKQILAHLQLMKNTVSRFQAIAGVSCDEVSVKRPKITEQ